MSRPQHETAKNALPAPRDNAFAHRYGPWAVVTGASDGIGLAIARELAARGLHLVVVARRGERLQQLARELAGRHGVECQALAADLGTAEGCEAVRRMIAAHEVGVLVAAAGFGTSGAFVDSPLGAEREMLAVNCASVLELVGHVAPRMADRGRGGIVLLSSVLAFNGVPGSAHYAATKAWVQSLAEGLRGELRGRGVDVLASAPGPVDTGFAARARLAPGTMLSAEVVARQTIDALGRQGTVRPGWLSKLLGWSLATLPRPMRVVLLARVMKGMTGRRRDGGPGVAPTR
ncbi:SDR family NAD(P)-dependent oxidoreductase [Piscinibacter defluvii]|uniref:SDR family NAD(P)-dependent oxidoreductase n=1 Tax=Piscinibacter defluvii TaxID=1796922 RepID=UPI000FDEBD37|nr:SDR family oxidoreductase [Piscinibacter defluvii]